MDDDLIAKNSPPWPAHCIRWRLATEGWIPAYCMKARINSVAVPSTFAFQIVLCLFITVENLGAFSCDTTMVVHWPTGGAGMMSWVDFGLLLIAVAKCRPQSDFINVANHTNRVCVKIFRALVKFLIDHMFIVS